MFFLRDVIKSSFKRSDQKLRLSLTQKRLMFLIKIFYNVWEQKLLPKLEYSKTAWDEERLYNDWCVGTSKVKLEIPFSLNLYRLPSSISALSLHVTITWWVTRDAISRICPRLLNILIGTIDEKPLETNHTESKPKPKTPKIHNFLKNFQIFFFLLSFFEFCLFDQKGIICINFAL